MKERQIMNGVRTKNRSAVCSQPVRDNYYAYNRIGIRQKHQ